MHNHEPRLMHRTHPTLEQGFILGLNIYTLLLDRHFPSRSMSCRASYKVFSNFVVSSVIKFQWRKVVPIDLASATFPFTLGVGTCLEMVWNALKNKQDNRRHVPPLCLLGKWDLRDLQVKFKSL